MASTKVKPPSHLFRVGTDSLRQEYRRNRAAAIATSLARRERAADELSRHAAVHVEREKGYVVCPAGTIPGLSDVVEYAHQTLASADLMEIQANAHKSFLLRLVTKHTLTLDTPLLRFALRDDILGTAARYLGMVPILQFANVLYSSHTADEPAKSQLYHCDSDEAEQMKLFILCEEVTPDTGPLTFLRADQSQSIRDRVQYRYKERLSDDVVRQSADGPVEEIALTGPAETAAFLDTSRCFHYGSRFTDASARRLVVMLQYITPLAFTLPDNYTEGATFRHLSKPEHDELTKMVLGTM